MKKEPITTFDLEAAFKALNDIDVPVVEGGILPNRMDLNETLIRKNKTEALMEDYYDVSSNEELEEAAEEREAEVAKAKLARIEKIVDLDAETEDDILPSYVGKVIMQCPQCMTLFYKNPEDIEHSEENPDVVNINEICQHCGNSSGYTLIGKVDGVSEEEANNYEAAEEEASGEEDELNLDFEAPTEEVDAEGTGEAEVTEEDEFDLGSTEETAEEGEAKEEEEEKKEESLATEAGETVLNEEVSLNEEIDKELDKKLKAHNDYIEYLKKMISQEEEALKRTDNEEVKAAIQRRLDAFEEDLKAALPDSLKDEAVSTEELPTPEEAGSEEVAEEKVEESLQEGYTGNPAERTTHLEYTDDSPADGKAVLPDNIEKQLTEAEEIPVDEEAPAEEEKVEETPEVEFSTEEVKEVAEDVAEAVVEETGVEVEPEVVEEKVEEVVADAVEEKVEAEGTEVEETEETEEIVEEGLTESASDVALELEKFCATLGESCEGGECKECKEDLDTELKLAEYEASLPESCEGKECKEEVCPKCGKAPCECESLKEGANEAEATRIAKVFQAGPKFSELTPEEQEIFKSGDEEAIKKFWDEHPEYRESLEEAKGNNFDVSDAEFHAMINDPTFKEFGESLDEHINDRPADIESEQKLQGGDNAVVDCETEHKIITHSEDEKPLDCNMEKPALEKPVAGEQVDVKITEEKLTESPSNIIDMGVYHSILDRLEHAGEGAEVEENLEEEKEVEPEDLDESTFDARVSDYLTEVYSNVEKFETTACSQEDNKLIIEGNILFKSGNRRPTTFEFTEAAEQDVNRKGVRIYEGFNKDFSDGNAFRLTCALEDGGKIIATSNIDYKYSINETLVEGTK